MSFAITVISDVECPDKGVATMSSSAKLTVSGKNVVVKDNLVGATLGGCQQASSPPASVTCATLTEVISGEATKLTVGGQAVLLDSLKGLTSGAPKNQLTCKDAKQTKLTAK
jgi:hypothetical protein